MRPCPLCKKSLITKYPKPPDTIIRLICSTHVPSTKLSHYYIEVGANQVEVIHTPPYSLINNSSTDRTDIYPLNIISVNGVNGITKQKKIASLPRFPLGDPEKLNAKIKLYVLFS